MGRAILIARTCHVPNGLSYEGLRILIALIQIVEHGFLQQPNGSVTAAPYTTHGYFREESLH
jgi:hypothetical protein